MAFFIFIIMKASLIQFDIEWENPKANQMRIDRLLNLKKPGDIIVLPEMWSTGFTMSHKGLSENMNGPGVNQMQEWANRHDALVIGSLIIREDDRTFNRCIMCQPDGSLEWYDKRHLFSFASENQHYSPGKEAKIIEYKGWKIMPQICYDLRFPVFSRYSQQTNYDLLIYVANWPARRVHAWSRLLTARAIENQAYCIGVNRTGLDGNSVYYNGCTKFIDFAGNDIVILPGGEFHETVQLSMDSLKNFRKKFPFLADRDIH